MNTFTFSKKLLLICFISLLSSTCFCQWPWDTNFPDSNATWINGEFLVNSQFNDGLQETDNYCLTANDTVINDLNYKILEQCTIDYQGAMRKDSTGSKVYFVPRDSTQEYLIYDFAAEEGDTLYDVFFQTGPELDDDKLIADIVITDLTTMISELYVSLHYDIISEDQYTGYIGVWVINIGELAGFLRPPGFYGESKPGAYIQEHLACHSYRDTVRLDYNYELLGTTNGCALDMSIEEGITNTDIKIYPNPTAEKLICVLPKPQRVEEVLIFNTMGQTVMTVRDITHTEMTFDMSDLPAGLYILKVKAYNQAVNRRFVKK